MGSGRLCMDRLRLSRRADTLWLAFNQFTVGIVDICGFPKDTFYYYKAWWGKEPALHMFPHWNFEGREGEEIPFGFTRTSMRLSCSSTATV